MKILQINAYNYIRGGSESVFKNTSSLLEAHGHEVMTYTLKWPENLPSKYSTYFPESKETRSGVLRIPRNILTYFYNDEAARNLDRLLREEKPDIAHVHLIWGQLTPSILPVLHRHGIPVVHTAHDYRMICPAYSLRNGKGEICHKCADGNFMHCVIEKCNKNNRMLSAMMAAEQYYRNHRFNPSDNLDGIIYVSDFSRDTHQRLMPSLAKVPSEKIYNFSTSIATEPFAKSRVNKRISDSYYLYYGRLSHEKGLITLLKAFSDLADIKLKIMGSGPLESQLKQFAEERAMTNVSFIGRQTGHELMEIVGQAEFVILPSECYENNPMTIIEPYSLGVPVIGANIGGIPEIITPDTGLTFSSGDADSLKEAVRKSSALSDERYNELANGALQFARNNFEPEEYYNRLIKFYTRIISSYKQKTK
ncbi:MAG: glycosyltransferase family 4 protein [Bacteroides sp.]|nr:glycosyltransferase family 4 protein [Bacteroides sp.]